jgi:hypothetical protein
MAHRLPVGRAMQSPAPRRRSPSRQSRSRRSELAVGRLGSGRPTARVSASRPRRLHIRVGRRRISAGDCTHLHAPDRPRVRRRRVRSAHHRAGVEIQIGVSALRRGARHSTHARRHASCPATTAAHADPGQQFPELERRPPADHPPARRLHPRRPLPRADPDRSSRNSNSDHPSTTPPARRLHPRRPLPRADPDRSSRNSNSDHPSTTPPARRLHPRRPLRHADPGQQFPELERSLTRAGVALRCGGAHLGRQAGDAVGE